MYQNKYGLEIKPYLTIIKIFIKCNMLIHLMIEYKIGKNMQMAGEVERHQYSLLVITKLHS